MEDDDVLVIENPRAPQQRQQKLDLSVERAVSELRGQTPNTCPVFSDEQRKWLHESTRRAGKNTDVAERFAQHFGVTISTSTISNFRKMEPLEQAKKRGRDHIMNEAEEAQLMQAFTRIRAAGIAVRARAVASVARGIIERSRTGATSLSGGAIMVSISWATKWMHSQDIKVLAATTDRNIPAAEVVEGGRIFYETLKGLSAAPENVYNVDEFFCVLDEGGNRAWTWERCPLTHDEMSS